MHIHISIIIMSSYDSCVCIICDDRGLQKTMNDTEREKEAKNDEEGGGEREVENERERER